MRIYLRSAVIVTLLLSRTSLAAPDAIKGLVTGDSATALISAAQLSSQPPESLAVWIRNFNDFPPPDTLGWATMLKHEINDTFTAPAWLYIPTSYKSHSPTPFVIALHGGVSGEKFRDASTKNWHDDTVFQLAEQHGWLVLYPLGKTGCAWWDKVGMDNILWYVREVKRRYNVDDDRITMCGFSDGGSGSYHFAMLAPTDFAVFFPWSGNPSVGTHAGGIQTYLENMQRRPLFASNGGKDQLYPAVEIERHHRLILNTGASLSASYCDTAGHNVSYMKNEWQAMPDRFSRNSRDPFPPEIYLETADIGFGAADWLQITTIDTSRDSAWWYEDLNLKETDDRISIGFNPDQEYTGKGVRIGGVSRDPESPAFKAGVQVGDIIVQIDDIKIAGMDDVVRAKEGRKRGDKIKLIFKRGSKKIVSESTYPPSQEYDAYPRNQKSGVLRARRVGNTFEIQSMRVSALGIFLSPDLVRFEQPVKVLIAQDTNLKEVFNSVVTPNSKTMLKHFLKDRDRKRMVYAELNLDVPQN